MRTAILFLVPVAPLLFIQPALQAATVELTSFGARPNDAAFNSRPAFQSALASLASQGGGTLHIPQGDYYLDFPDIASDLDPKDAANRSAIRQKNLSRSKLIMAPPGVELVGDSGGSGNPATKIHWKASGFPIFSFVNSDRSGIRNVAFIYDGVQPQFFPWSQEDYLDAAGVHARWLGGPYEISAVIYAIGSEGVRFENLTFASSMANNEHTFAFGIVAKGKTPIPIPAGPVVSRLAIGGKIPGGGLSACVAGNVYRNLSFADFVMGILASGQCSPVFENISGDHRGSWFRSFDPSREPGGAIRNIGPPGHLIYLTFQEAEDVVRSAAHPEGEMTASHPTRNTNITLRNISEGKDTFSNFNSSGTLALKDIDGGVIENVSSQHPIGLIQSLIDVHNLTLENLSWSSDRDPCSEPDSKLNCNAPVITFVGGPDASTEICDHVTFRNVSFKSPHWAAIFQIASGTTPSHDITVDGLTVESSPLLHSGQSGPKGIVTIQAAAIHFTHVSYLPVVPPGPVPSNVNYAVQIQPGSVDTTVDVKIRQLPGTAANAAVYRTLVVSHSASDETSGKDGVRITRNFVN